MLGSAEVIQIRLTLSGPVFLRVAEKHDKFFSGESLEIVDWEDFREPFLECLYLRSNPFSEDRVEDFMDIFLDVACRYRDVFTSGLNEDQATP